MDDPYTTSGDLDEAVRYRRRSDSGPEVWRPDDLSVADGEVLDEIRLLGQPPLCDFLAFLDNAVVDGKHMNRAELADEWRTANDYYHELEESEAGYADEIELRPLDPACRSLANDAMADPRYRYTYDTFPTSFMMVELDRLVVFQTHVTRQFTDKLAAQLAPSVEPEALFRFCLPPEAADTPVQTRKIGSERYAFTSESTDFRPHKPVLLRPDQICDHTTFGPMSGVVGLVVGFGSNFFTAIHCNDRLLLHNGYHRAYAMRAMGITHAPCIVQTVTRRDELEVAVKSVVADDPAFYFGSGRPPVLKDFFDPRIAKTFKVHKMLKMIEVSFSVRDFAVRA